MKERFTDEQIIGILREAEIGAMSIKALCRKHNLTRKLPLIPDTPEVELSGIFPPGGSMKKSKFSEAQIVSILKQGDAGIPVKDLCRQAGISTATYYQWKSKYGGMEASDLRRVRDLEAENAKLKRMYAELALDNAAMKDLIAKKL